MAKKTINTEPIEQVYLSPKADVNKIYVYLFMDKRLWKMFFTQPPYIHKPIYHYLKQLI